MAAKCSICLSSFKDPVCIPCGHVYCTKCLSDHVNTSNSDETTSACPTCRTTFTIVTPDLTYLPKKYHQYVGSSVRRVYIDTSGYANLQKKLTRAEARIKMLEDSQEVLLGQCEQHMAAAHAHSQGEKEARLKSKALKDELDKALGRVALDAEHSADVHDDRESLRKKYEKLKRHVRDLEAQLNEGNAEPSSVLRKRKEKSRRSSDTSELIPEPVVLPQPEEVPIDIPSTSTRKMRPLPRSILTRAQHREAQQSGSIWSPPPNFGDRMKRPRLSVPMDTPPADWDA